MCHLVVHVRRLGARRLAAHGVDERAHAGARGRLAAGARRGARAGGRGRAVEVRRRGRPVVGLHAAPQRGGLAGQVRVRGDAVRRARVLAVLAQRQPRRHGAVAVLLRYNHRGISTGW